MRIKLDENLPDRLVAALTNLGHDVDTVRAEHMAGRDDSEISDAARQADRFLITQDLDFSDIRQYRPGTHPGVLLVRLHRPGRTALFDRIVSLFAQEDVSTWSRCLVVATERKLRIRRPESA